MKFPTDRPVKVVMLGAGGTGAYVAPHVYRLLHVLDRPARFIICDGDIVEAKNLIRQNFVPADLGENKARVLAERYSTVLGIETEYVPNFIEKLPDLMELIEPESRKENPYSYRQTKDMVILLGCVDNNKTRQLCHQAFNQCENLIYIDSGNGEYTGQVVCGVRRNGRTVLKSIGGVHPEMLKATDKFPSEVSCAEAAQEDPQSRTLHARVKCFECGDLPLIPCAQLLDLGGDVRQRLGELGLVLLDLPAGNFLPQVTQALALLLCIRPVIPGRFVIALAQFYQPLLHF